MEKLVLAFSGGLDTSVILKLLSEKYEVIAVTIDVGQPLNLNAVAQRAEKIGASKAYILDSKEEFVEQYVIPSIKANALYEGKYPISTALTRPLIAKKLVEIAEKEGANIVAHGCTGKGNDQVRFEITIRALNPKLKILAPVRDWNLSRDKVLEIARKYGLPVPISREPYSVDENLWGRSIECGPLDFANKEPPPEVFKLTTPPEKAPDKPEHITIEFKEGVPIALNNECLKPLELISRLNAIAARHGIGRIDHIEDRVVGIKSREVYECPAALCLIEAHRDLEKMVLTKHQISFKKLVDDSWTYLVYTGLWVDPLREDLEAFINSTQKVVTGRVFLKLYKGGLSVIGRESPFSLYDIDLAKYEADSTFDQSLSAGFIEIWGLQSKLAKLKRRLLT